MVDIIILGWVVGAYIQDVAGLSVKNECVIWYWIAQIVCAIGSGTRSVPPRL